MQALERELDGARSDFKDLNGQLDKAEGQTTSLKEEKKALEKRLNEEEQDRRRERNEMEEKINALRTDGERIAAEIAQVLFAIHGTTSTHVEHKRNCMFC